MKDHSQKIKALQTLIFKCPRLQLCDNHALPLQLICMQQNCKQYLVTKCTECAHEHKMLNVKKIVPLIAKWLNETWDKIRTENIEIESEWKICLVNIDYCFDILGEVKKMIENRKLHELPAFENIIDITTEMAKQNSSLQAILKNLELMNRRYELFEGCQIQGDCVDKERIFRMNKWLKMGKKTKAFSEKALAFSQTLAQTIDDKLKYEKRMKHLQTLTASKISNLQDLLKQNVQEINNLKIEMNKTDLKEEEESIQKYLQRCENLKTVYINNKNGKIIHKTWEMIIGKFQSLKKLKELKLNIRADDLKLLTKLFKEKPNSVRYIETLHLTITDEPKLDMKDVSQFCNTLQLRHAHLTLTRDNITKTNFKQFLQDLRVHTSLSKLPMKELSINITKNKVTDSKDISDCEQDFYKKSKEIKQAKILI